ncbi:hypothetical protein [Staphylococcus chromogenes]|uniref:hypothetical protein n=1 Tax=Staphylococcus chromogenes TaxID=46126 RepID=UPI0021CE2818|nr:hypothetical protein [Staphylococcus chromogenes]UXS76356.1 hypothetical protein MUA20_04820 [Staphylococcus chromogenes]
MDAAKMKKRSLKNRDEKLIQGYYYCINYIDEKLRSSINRGEFVLKLRIGRIKLVASLEGFKITDDTIKAAMYHYKRKGINSRIQKIPDYQTPFYNHFDESYLILDWSCDL